MSGDGGTIRSVVSKSVQTTPETPSSFARPYFMQEKTAGGIVSADLTEINACPARRTIWRPCTVRQGKSSFPAKALSRRPGERKQEERS